MIVLKNTEQLKIALEAISLFIPEGNFRFSDDGIHFNAVDPTQIVFLNYFIDKKVFDEYDIEPSYVGINILEFNRIIQRAMPEDKLFLELTDSELKIRLESSLKRSFRLPLIDVSGEESKEPSTKYDSKIIIGSTSLKEMIKDAVLFGTSVILRIKTGNFFVEANGPQGTMVSEATLVSKITAKEEINSKFSLSFFQKIIRCAEQGEKITLELKNDSPIRISYNIGKSKITFYLAHMLL